MDGLMGDGARTLQVCTGWLRTLCTLAVPVVDLHDKSRINSECPQRCKVHVDRTVSRRIPCHYHIVALAR